MRAVIVASVVLGLAAGGCQAFGDLGFHEVERENWAEKSTKPGEVVDADRKIVVEKFDQDFKSSPAKVLVTLRNDGTAIGDEGYNFEVEFGYALPADALVPFEPDFVDVFVQDWKSGDRKQLPVPAPPGHNQAPVFAKIVTGVRMLTARESRPGGPKTGRQFLGGKVEVVDLTFVNIGDKPSLTFTLQNVDRDSTKPVGDLSYTVYLFSKGYKNGAEPLPFGRRFYAWKTTTLGGKGEKVTLKVIDPDSGTKLPEEVAMHLPGAIPVLYVKQ
jgi:hypothetical protein